MNDKNMSITPEEQNESNIKRETSKVNLILEKLGSVIGETSKVKCVLCDIAQLTSEKMCNAEGFSFASHVINEIDMGIHIVLDYITLVQNALETIIEQERDNNK